MVQNRTCDFSGEDIEPGTGIMFVRNDGTILHFKDGKAEKNYFMGREARNLEWTSAGQANKGPVQQTQPEAEPEPEPEPEPETESDADAAPDLGAVEDGDADAETAPEDEEVGTDEAEEADADEAEADVEDEAEADAEDEADEADEADAEDEEE